MEGTARERLVTARRLIESVMGELDTELIDCPCEQHVRHARNWDHAQLNTQLEALARKLGAFANGRVIGELSALR